MLPVAAGVRGTIKNDETRPSDGGNVEGVRRCLRERSFVPRAVVYHQRGYGYSSSNASVRRVPVILRLRLTFTPPITTS